MKAPPPNTFVGLAGSPAGTTLGTGADAGIKALANEVGAMPGVQPTISGYGAAAPAGSSVLPPAAGGPAPGIDQLVQTNLTSAGANLPVANEAGITSASNASTTNPLYQLDKAPNPYAQGLNPTGGVSLDASLKPSGDPFYNINSSYVNQLGVRPGYGLTDVAVQPSALAANAAPESGGLQGLFNQGVDYVKKNPLTSAMFANTAYQMLNQPKQFEKPKYKSTFNAGAYSGYEPATPNYYRAQYAHGGLADLGGYSDGGRMLKGPGDGMSDDIPATIANKQPARLANEEFVIPADVVSHLGNGSSEAGAKQLYKMMDRVRQARTGNKKQGKQINPEKYLA